ncbi:PRC-barrel domain-containing protein [Hyphococcus luteus]|nr:PRC-barrel domain-containing protein [Marinicaulis flavus]
MTNNLLSSSTITGDHVKNAKGEDLGKIEDLMIDTNDGAIQYAVLSFGGIMGLGEKLFAVPFGRLKVDTENKCMILDADKQRLKDAPGFDKDKWPDFSDASFKTTHDAYYK